MEMAIRKELRKRPIRIYRDDDIKPENLERLYTHYDERLSELDQRRIAQQSEANEGSTDSETIQNILTVLNSLIDALNKSSITEE